MGNAGKHREKPLALDRDQLIRYGCAVLCVAAATWLRVLLDPIVGNASPYPAVILGVLATAWLAGSGPAIVAIALGLACGEYFVSAPRGSFALAGAAELVDRLLYLAAGAGAVFLRWGKGREQRGVSVRMTVGPSVADVCTRSPTWHHP